MTFHLLPNVRQAASPLLILVVMSYLYGLLHKYDWGHPLTKFGCLGAIFGLILFVRSRDSARQSSRRVVHFEVIATTLILVGIVATYARAYRADLFTPPRVDIGYTTVSAASMLIDEESLLE